MKKIISLIVLVLAVIAAMPETASAQCYGPAYACDPWARPRDPYYGRAYDYRYDRYRRRGPRIVEAIVEGAAEGFVESLMRRNRPSQVMVVSTPPTYESAPSPAPMATSVRREEDLPFVLKNETPVMIEIYDGEKRPENFVARLAPCGKGGDDIRADAPRERYTAYAVVLDERGRLDTREVPRKATPTGLAFVMPISAR